MPHSLVHYHIEGALVFGLLIWLILPWMVIAIDDDFRYLRSVVETCQRGRPWTYEWLTPWSASMSVLAASLFKITKNHSTAKSWSLWMGHGVVIVMMTLFCLWNIRCYIKQKYELDRIAAINTIYEQAFREGRCQPQEMGLAPFGYFGWRFERYFRTHEGHDSTDLAGFLKVVDGCTGETGMAVITELPESFDRYKLWFKRNNNQALQKNTEAKTLAELKAPVLWVFEAEYVLKKMPTPVSREGRSSFLESDYVDRPFPLNDEEWRQLINTGVESFKSQKYDASMPRIKP